MLLFLMLLVDLLGCFQSNANLMFYHFFFFINSTLWLNVSSTLKLHKSKLIGVGNFDLLTLSFINLALFIVSHVLIRINNKVVSNANIDTSLITLLLALLKSNVPKTFWDEACQTPIYKTNLLSQNFSIAAPITSF